MTDTVRNDYWVNKLAPFIRIEQTGKRTGSFPIELPAELLRGVGSEILISALALVWCRYTAADEVLLGGESSGTPLFYRVSYSPDESVASFVNRVSMEIEESALQSEYSLDAVLGLLDLEARGAAALFEIGLVSSIVKDRLPFMIAVDTSGGETVRLCFDSDRYDAAYANRFAGHYSRAVAFILEGGPDAALWRLDLLSSAEHAQLLAFNETAREYPSCKVLHSLVEEQAERTPDSVAVVYDTSTLTYAELNQRANRLAMHLRESLGVRTGQLVGLIVRRSEMMIVAILGILKAGAGYVPIDPRHPWETVSYMLHNAAIRTLLVNSDTAASASGFQGDLCFLDIEYPALQPCPRNILAGATDADLAYVIYTSGSTGQPKGVAVEHRAIVNTVLWRREYHGMDEHDATLQVPSYGFDSSVEDIFCSLTSGGKLVIPDEDLRLDAQYIKHLIQAHGVSRFLVTPSYYTQLTRELQGITGIRSVTVAGENITLDLVTDHHKHLPGVRLVNEYGPTENAVCSTACDLKEGSTGVHIGRPIANTQVFVLDPKLRMVPVGVPGEMYLAGAGLARGYVNQQSLTDERFVPSSVREFPGRMYKTGDRARWQGDGTLEFLGRLDNQVKIRGFRIELNEIEHALLKHPGVEMATVLCKQDQGGNKYLAAYVASPLLTPAARLSDWVKNLLPYYMAPDVISVMAKLPLNLNGKVDAGALAKLPDFERATDTGRRASTPMQESLAVLCSSVLQRGHIGLDEHFFDAIGASSLKVMQIVTRIRADLRAAIELQDVYAYPTVRELASRIEGRMLLNEAMPAKRTTTEGQPEII